MSPASPQKRDRSSYLSSDTIAALATAPGGAVGIIRLSGPEAFRIGARLDIEGLIQKGAPRALTRVALRSETGASLDDALVARFVAPESFTGEDVLEFHLHGGGFVLTNVLETLLRLGARQALPGEFSFRAVRNGKMSVTQAQAVADLIAASNSGAVGLALEKMSGTENRLLRGLAESVRDLAVKAELGIDFADQDLSEISLPRLKEHLLAPLGLLEKLRDSFDRGSRIQEGVSVAFVGLPNAGKSSLFNALLGEDRSIVSSVAGTTRDVIREKLGIHAAGQSLTLRLHDTAGLRTTAETVEKLGIERTARSVKESDLILFLVDCSTPFEESLAEWRRLGDEPSRALGIFTKCDLIGASDRGALLTAATASGISSWVFTSTVLGEGLTEAIQLIGDYCGRWTTRSEGEVLLTRVDHRDAVCAALAAVERAMTVDDLALFASDLRGALHSLGPLIGETPPDAILGKIFSDFCIGK